MREQDGTGVSADRLRDRMELVRVRDRGRIEGFLRRDAASHIYALADLDDFFWSATTWYAAQAKGAIRALCLILDRLTPQILYAVCAPKHRATRELVSAIRDRLPPRLYANLGVGLEDLFTGGWAFHSHGEHWKLLLVERAEPARVDTSGVERLAAADLAELEAFYRDEAYAPDERTGRFFEPYMLERGPCFAIREGGRLASVGGVHVFSPRYRVAALANIATRPDCRGRGLARAVTARLCQELSASADAIGLNVKADNQAALRCYEKLGFRVVRRYLEGIVERRP